MDFSVGNAKQQIAPNGIRFARVPTLGNAGRKIDAAVDLLFSPNLTDPKLPKPAEKKALEVIGLAPVREAKAFIDFLIGGGRVANPASAEKRLIKVSDWQPHDPDQTSFTFEELVAHVTETWKADP